MFLKFSNVFHNSSITHKFINNSCDNNSSVYPMGEREGVFFLICSQYVPIKFPHCSRQVPKRFPKFTLCSLRRSHYTTRDTQRNIGVFFQFCNAAILGDHPQEETTKFGYREYLKNPASFWVTSYISLLSKYGDFTNIGIFLGFFFPTKIAFFMQAFSFVFSEFFSLGNRKKRA